MRKSAINNLFMTYFSCPEGGSVTFTCRIEGKPSPEVSWLYNGKPLKDSKKYKMECGEAAFTLTLPKCKRDMSGTYTVRATNRNGTQDSSAELTVNLMGMYGGRG